MAGDDIDTFEIKGNLSVIASEDPGNIGDGSIDVGGTVNTDNIGCNVLENGLTIHDIMNYTQREINLPTTPVNGEHKFYIDTVDKKLKSINNANVITTYQPTTTKGDLLTHDGATQVRLPVSNKKNRTILTDPNTVTGLKWGYIDSNPPRTTAYLRSNHYTELLPDIKGSYILLVYNKIIAGASAIFFVSKSRETINGLITRTNSCPGTLNNSLLETQWLSLEEIELRKDSNPSAEDGDYFCNFCFNIVEDSLSLSGTTWLPTIDLSTTGNFVYCINSKDTDGPCAIFLATKSNPLLNTGNIVRISNSPANDTSVIEARWQASNALEFRKTSSLYNGDYFYIDILKLDQLQVKEVTLTGTSPVEIIKKYQRASLIVSVYKNDGNLRAIFTISKNDKTLSASITRHTYSSNDEATNLLLQWNASDSIKLYKTSSNYDGVYTINFL